MHWLLFLSLISLIGLPVAFVAMQEQRWFKKILFYYSPRYLRPLSHRLKPINLYYNHLTEEKRKEFNWRVYYFLDTTKIEFKHFKPTQLINFNAIRYLIASIATQMTLFLSEDSFDTIKRIIFFPDRYYSPITGKYHKGETNPSAGWIILSWESFKSGFSQYGDGINLLFHELAHALWLENKLYNYKIFDRNALLKYESTAAELMGVSENRNSFLRNYAYKNEEEFFAVVVENFFERPHLFKKELPNLYEAVVTLFNHDPIKYIVINQPQDSKS